MAAMETDEQQNTPQTNLRRSNSAPLINGANLNEANISYIPALTPRHRRSSTSQMANGNPYSVVSSMYLPKTFECRTFELNTFIFFLNDIVFCV